MKLISMTEFVLLQREDDKIENSSERFYNCEAYAKFLRQPLTLAMFVPVDEEGNVLERPYPSKYGYHISCSPEDQSGWMYEGGEDKYHEDLLVWEKAQEKVLFEGCEVIEIKKEINYFVVYHKSRQIWISWTDRIIEDMILSRTYLDGLELTPAALKQIGL